jgi:hypothetical protein
MDEFHVGFNILFLFFQSLASLRSYELFIKFIKKELNIHCLKMVKWGVIPCSELETIKQNCTGMQMDYLLANFQRQKIVL